MELGLSTGLFHNQDVIPYLPSIKEAGFEIIEICLDTFEWGTPNPFGVENSHFFLKEGLEIWQQRIHAYNLRNKLREFNIHVHSIHLPAYPELDIASLDERVRVHAVWEFKKGIDILGYLGGEIAVVHPTVQPFDLNNYEEKKMRVNKCRASLIELMEHSKQKKVKLAVENLLPHFLGGRAEDLNDIVNKLSEEEIGICFDSSHANLAQDPAEMLRNFDNRVICLHLSDNHGQYDDHLTPGDGRIFWPSLVSGLKEIGYKNVFMLEVFEKEQSADLTSKLSYIYERAKGVLNKEPQKTVENVVYRL